MTRPPDPDRRRVGRRQSDGLLERDIKELRRAFDRLERTVLPVAGQVADVDGSLQALQASLRALERWLEDERAARRHHDAELDDAIDAVRVEAASGRGELRERIDTVDRNLRTIVEDKVGECMKAIGSLGADSRAGRRTILITIITTAGVVLAAYLTGSH